MSSTARQVFNIKLHRELHHNDNPFVVRKYDGRYKKCRGCGKSFSNQHFVIAHEEHYVVSGRSRYFSRRVRAAEGNKFYHCDTACIQPRHPYFHMGDVAVHPAIMCQLRKGDDNAKFFLSPGIKLYYWTLD